MFSHPICKAASQDWLSASHGFKLPGAKFCGEFCANSIRKVDLTNQKRDHATAAVNSQASLAAPAVGRWSLGTPPPPLNQSRPSL